MVAVDQQLVDYAHTAPAKVRTLRIMSDIGLVISLVLLVGLFVLTASHVL